MLVVRERYLTVLSDTELVIYEDTEQEIINFMKSAADKFHTELVSDSSNVQSFIELVSDSSSVQSFIEFRAWKILV